MARHRHGVAAAQKKSNQAKKAANASRKPGADAARVKKQSSPKPSAAAKPEPTKATPKPKPPASTSAAATKAANTSKAAVAAIEIADVPYKLKTVNPLKRKRDNSIPARTGYDEGKNAFDDRLSVHYKVQALQQGDTTAAQWRELKGHRSFQNGEDTVSKGSVVLVQSGDDAYSQRYRKDAGKDADDLDGCYVAQILEIRALDPDHVYCRIWWLYRPEEPAQGRQPYHGEGEVMPSNYMDIIDATSVQCVVNIQHVGEPGAEIKPFGSGYEDLCWRYPYDSNTKLPLDKPLNICVCKTPANPDFGPLLCNGAKGCGKWQHEECLTDSVLERIYNSDASKQEKTDETNGNTGGFFQAAANIVLGGVAKAKSRSKSPNVAAMSQDPAPTARPADPETVKSAKREFDVELRRPPKTTDPRSPLQAQVTSLKLSNVKLKGKKQDKPVSEQFEEPVLCLFCGTPLLQQIGHALLDPQMDDEEEGELKESIEAETAADEQGVNRPATKKAKK